MADGPVGGTPAMTPLRTLADDLDAGRTTSRNLVEQALARIGDPAGEGARVMLKVDEDAARAAADESDRLRAAGIVVSPIAGLPVSLKDLFDVAGEVTTAGSVVLQNAAPAAADAAVVARLRRAGAVIIGRTNMTEFAYSGLGLNPVTEGQLIRVPIPELSEERRVELARIAGKYAEQARIALRNVRRDGMDTLKRMEKASEMSQDEQRRWSEEIQEVTDQTTKIVDETLAAKESEIMQV